MSVSVSEFRKKNTIGTRTRIGVSVNGTHVYRQKKPQRRRERRVKAQRNKMRKKKKSNRIGRISFGGRIRTRIN